MKLLTQDEGSRLKKGDVVNVWFFSPRKPKGVEEPFSRQRGGRQEWVDGGMKNQVVSCDAWKTTHEEDGYAVKLQGHGNIWLTQNMEKVDA